MKVGFIGCGNMAEAMIRGIVHSKGISPEDVIASAKSERTKKRIREELKITGAENNRQVVEKAEVVFLAVKPQYYEEVIREIREEVRGEQVIVTIAPGKTLEWLGQMFDKPVKVIRTMPNTPAMVKEGMTGLCKNQWVTDQEMKKVRELFDCFGKTEEIPENLLDVVVGVSGSSPAYAFLFIEALADGAVSEGMPRAQAYKFAAQAVLGSAKMVLETGLHPGELKDMVCSPGGTTIEAVRVLEEKGMRSAVIEASKACVRKGRGM